MRMLQTKRSATLRTKQFYAQNINIIIIKLIKFTVTPLLMLCVGLCFVWLILKENITILKTTFEELAKKLFTIVKIVSPEQSSKPHMRRSLLDLFRPTSYSSIYR